MQVRPVQDGERELAAVLAEWADTVGLRFKGSLRLAMAETKLAVTTFALVIFLAVLSAGAVVLAWGLIVIALVQALSLAGLTLLLAVLAIALLHLAAAWSLWRLANRLSRHMEFRATRGMLKS